MRYKEAQMNDKEEELDIKQQNSSTSNKDKKLAIARKMSSKIEGFSSKDGK